MIPFDAVLVTGSTPWLAAGWSEALLTLSAGVFAMGLADITAGITGRLSGGDEGDEPDVDDDFMGSGEDADGFDDDEFGDDEFGDLDGWDEDDEFGESGGALDEIEPRLNELENEVASISSTMGTVRSENEAINETVGDIEDNIRKLLEIYEMVTRGVNPFVDDVEGSAGMGSSFGLFEGDGSGDDDVDDIDPDVAEADADSFFDDDWDDEGTEDVDEFDEDLEDGEMPDPESDDGGKTFDQLKSEYEEGDADWTGDGDATSEATEGGSNDPTDGTVGDESGSAPVEPGDAFDDADVDFEDGGAEGVESIAEGTLDAEGADEEEAPTVPTADGEEDEATRSGEKPYLRTLPGGYATELLVVEWLTYLQRCSSTPEALRAIRYYETIGWIGEPAADALAKFLTGLDDGEVSGQPTGGTQLTVDHHTQSLRYIGRLGGTDVQIERLDWAGSPRNVRIEGGKQRGIQR